MVRSTASGTRTPGPKPTKNVANGYHPMEVRRWPKASSAVSVTRGHLLNVPPRAVPGLLGGLAHVGGYLWAQVRDGLQDAPLFLLPLTLLAAARLPPLLCSGPHDFLDPLWLTSV